MYDMTMGTSQMLSCMEERIHEINPDMEVTCFGQEFNPSTFAIAKADMMIRGGNPDNMRFGDTLVTTNSADILSVTLFPIRLLESTGKENKMPLKQRLIKVIKVVLLLDCPKSLMVSSCLC